MTTTNSLPLEKDLRGVKKNNIGSEVLSDEFIDSIADEIRQLCLDKTFPPADEIVEVAVFRHTRYYYENCRSISPEDLSDRIRERLVQALRKRKISAEDSRTEPYYNWRLFPPRLAVSSTTKESEFMPDANFNKPNESNRITKQEYDISVFVEKRTRQQNKEIRKKIRAKERRKRAEEMKSIKENDKLRKRIDAEERSTKTTSKGKKETEGKSEKSKNVKK